MPTTNVRAAHGNVAAEQTVQVTSQPRIGNKCAHASNA